MPTRGPYATSPMPTQPRTLAERLRWLRKQSGLTQVEVSQALGCEQAMISSWEVGRTRPSAVTLGALAKHYGVSLASLDTGHGFLEEATRRPLPEGEPEGSAVETTLTLPPVPPGQVMLLDERTGTQTSTDPAEAMSALLRALKKGRKAWLVVR
jgi:transcriptional regulator with XRE-family HTH domain